MPGSGTDFLIVPVYEFSTDGNWRKILKGDEQQ